jgi:zinc-ribbon domain
VPFCQQCGTQIGDDDAFCRNCGKSSKPLATPPPISVLPVVDPKHPRKWLRPLLWTVAGIVVVWVVNLNYRTLVINFHRGSGSAPFFASAKQTSFSVDSHTVCGRVPWANRFSAHVLVQRNVLYVGLSGPVLHVISKSGSR